MFTNLYSAKQQKEIDQVRYNNCSDGWRADTYFVSGVIIGIAGIAGMLVTQPLYTHITKKRREKLAPLILKLTEELSQQK